MGIRNSKSRPSTMEGMDVDPPVETSGPVLIQDVLGAIFQYIDNTTDLRNCRLVNSIWNTEACKRLQKRFQITFLDNQAISSYLGTFQDPGSDHPHAIYQFYNTEFQDSNAVLQQFFARFGSCIKVLKLQLNTIPLDCLYNVLRHHAVNLQSLHLRTIPVVTAVDAKKKEKWKETPGPSRRTFPNVQILTVGTKNFMPSALPADVTTTAAAFAELLKLFPNLRKISISDIDELVSAHHRSSILKGILTLVPEQLRNLTMLNFPIEVDDEVLPLLTKLGCQYLDDLNMTVTTYLQKQNVVAFFSMVGPTMTKLSLTFPKIFHYSFGHSYLLGKALRNMKELTLTSFHWNLGFLQSLLRLEKLVLKDTDVTGLFPSNMNVDIKLRVLKIQFDDSPPPLLEGRGFEKIATNFQWLQVLALPGVTDSCLRVIYFNLPHLTSLECVKGEFTDYGITGVELEICKDLAETTTYHVVNSDKLRSDLFIGNLMRLQRLHLESDVMGDLSILFGICKCLKLESLYLKSPNITDMAIEAITDQLGCSLQLVNLLHCPAVTEAGKFYIRESLPTRGVLVEDEPNMEAFRNAQRARITRYHRYCDEYVSRKLALANIQAEERALLAGIRNGNPRRHRFFRFGRGQNHQPAQAPVPNHIVLHEDEEGEEEDGEGFLPLDDDENDLEFIQMVNQANGNNLPMQPQPNANVAHFFDHGGGGDGPQMMAVGEHPPDGVYMQQVPRGRHIEEHCTTCRHRDRKDENFATWEPFRYHLNHPW